MPHQRPGASPALESGWTCKSEAFSGHHVSVLCIHTLSSLLRGTQKSFWSRATIFPLTSAHSGKWVQATVCHDAKACLALSIFRLLFGAYTGFLWAQNTHFFQTYLRSELNLQPKRNYKNSSSHTSRVSTWTFIKGDPLSKYLGLSVLSHIKGNSFCQSRKLL